MDPKAPIIDQKGSRAFDEDFQRIYKEGFGYVFNTLLRLGAGADAEDLSHEVFLTAYRKLASYDRARPLNPWLFGIAYRVASDFRKRSRTRREVFEEPPDLPDERPGSEAQLMERQRRRVVLDALDELALEKRAVLVMCDLEGSSVPDAAEALKWQLNTAYSRLRVARLEFAAALRRRALVRGDA
jgi:RNA polymerase sigma-70 factor, ECF subfamily